jgi:Saxitoxin biosynthesis operon protein SxtJ
LFSIKKHRAASRKQLRSFGFILAGGFLVIGCWRMVFRHQDPRWWALAISATSGLAGLIAPSLLRRPYQIWMFLGQCLGWVNTRIMLGGLYYLVVTPMRVVMTIAGHDPMNRKFDRNAETYRVIRKSRPNSHVTHQF